MNQNSPRFDWLDPRTAIDRVEVGGCVVIDNGETLERTDEEDATVFTVYLHTVDRGVESILDFDTRAAANFVGRQLAKALTCQFQPF